MKAVELRSVRSENLKFSDGQALPNASNSDSTNILDIAGGGIMGLTPIYVRIKPPAVTLTATLEVKVLTCDTEDGTYEEICAVRYYAGAVTAEDWKAVGLIDTKSYLKLNYSTTQNLSASAISADLVANV